MAREKKIKLTAYEKDARRKRAKIKIHGKLNHVPDKKKQVCEQFNEIIQQNDLVLVSVRQDQCRACPVYERKVLRKTDKKFDIPRIDLDLHSRKQSLPAKYGDEGDKMRLEDKCEGLADYLQVEDTPMTILFKSGIEVGRISTVGDSKQDKEALQNLLSRFKS